MSDQAASALAPISPAPPPAPAPAAPAAPVAPAAPSAPAPVAPAEPKLTPQETADKAEDDEWDSAADELFPGLKSTQKKEAKKDEPAKPDEKTETPKPGEKAEVEPDETPEQKAEREAKEVADAAAVGEEDGAPDTTARDNRVAARQAAEQVKVVADDVRKQMFSEAPQQLQDSDGDPISSIEDVMALINPLTGEAFTQEEAGIWLLSAQQKFNQNLAVQEKQIEEIAEVNVDLKDQADAVTYKYGELLKHPDMVDMRDKLWAEFEKTLVKDPASGIITKMPVSLENFYEIALAPYATMAQKLETDESAQATADAAAAANAAKAAERADRSDIFGGAKPDANADPEDKEWADAATAVFGPIKK